MVKPVERALVIGAAGFLGTAVSRYFARQGLDTVGLDVVAPAEAAHYQDFHQCGDLDAELGPILQKFRPTYLINLAGNANVGRSVQEPRHDFLLSANLYSSILETVRLHSSDTKLLLASSAAIYGQPAHLPVTEDMQPQPMSPYGYHKLICEQLASAYHSIYGLKVASGRIFSAYGSGLKKQIVWDLCQKCATGGPIELGGDGTESRDFIHSLDIARASLCIFRGGAFGGESYNVASGIETTISELAHRVVGAFGSPERIVFTGTRRAGDPKNWCADIRLIGSLGFQPEVQIADGIAEYVEWFKTLR
jgi:UDP-glucose 4-epimerase